MTKPKPAHLKKGPQKRPSTLGRPKRAKAGLTKGEKSEITEDEKQERLDFMLAQIGACRYKSEIKKAFREKFGNVSAQVIERELSRARAYLAECRRSKGGEILDELTSIYKEVIRDAASKGGERVRAADSLGKLYGVAALRNEDEAAPTTAVTVRVVVEDQRSAATAPEEGADVPG